MTTTIQTIEDRIAAYEERAENLYTVLADLSPAARTLVIGDIDACYEAAAMLRAIIHDLVEVAA